METLKLIYLISFSLTFLIITVSLFSERKSINTIIIDLKGNRRVIIVFIITISVGVYNLIGIKSISNIINSHNYKYVYFLLILCSTFWIFKSIKAKKNDLILKAVDKKLNFEEFFIYVIIINALFPLGSDIINSGIKFPIQLSLTSLSDYPSYLTNKNYANIHDVINIQNNEDKIYNVRIETFASQFRTNKFLDSISNGITKDYNFYQKNAVIYFKNEGMVNANSNIELDMISSKAFIPNFIENALDCDSIGNIITGDTLYYFNHLFRKDKQMQIKDIESINGKNYNYFKIKLPEISWYYTFNMNWISKITLSNHNYNSTYTFKINRYFFHKATILINKLTGKIYLAPGIINNNCNINIKYLYNQKETLFTKDVFSCQFIYDFNNGQTIYKDLGTGIIFLGQNNENIVTKENSFNNNLYMSALYLIDEKYYKQLIDNILK